MKELFNRLAKNPGTTFELISISFVANILALASSVFVMLVLGRYVSYGIDATLYTLTAGVIIAIVMEFAFPQLRLRLVKSFNIKAENELAIGAFGMLVSVKSTELEKLHTDTSLQLT